MLLGLVRLLERVTTSVGYLAALSILPLIAVTCYEVFSRYIFDAPTIWAFELGYMLTGAHFLLGAGLTLARGGHIRIDLIYEQLPARVQAGLDAFFYIAMYLPFLYFISLALWNYMAQAYDSGELSGQSAWNPPIWPFRFVFFLGFALLGLQAVAETLKALRTVALGGPAAREGR